MTNAKQKYLLKGDISGIQEFIFNVSSKKAAKSLKARSFFIQKLSELALDYVKNKNKGKCDKIYDGGGNFYIEIDDFSLNDLSELQEYMNKQSKEYDFYISLSAVPLSEYKKFGDAWKAVNQASNIAKLHKYQHTEINIFETFSYEPKKQYISLDIIDEYDAEGNKIEFEGEIFEKDIKELFIKEELELKKANKDKTKLFKGVPLWKTELINDCTDIIESVASKSDEEAPKTNKIISFQYLAEFARKRTGTDLIGILKMDVDNLHYVFDDLENKEDAINKSSQFKSFFEEKIYKFINEFEAETNKETDILSYNLMKNNIYPVFSGGDDCFFIGSWDYILDFARFVRSEFIKEFNPDEDKKKPTLSAAITLTDAHFPVIRFADIVEDRLSDAKKYSCFENHDCIPKKNAISFMGEVISWNDLEILNKIINNLYCIIDDEPAVRNLLYTVAASGKDFNILQNKAVEGKMNLPEIWRLFYTVKRNVKSERIREDIEEKILKKYETALLDAYSRKIKTNPVIFPLAARYTEFLTKK